MGRAIHKCGQLVILTEMRTTIEVNDELFRKAKQLAAAEGMTLREIVESGMRAELARHRRGRYRMPDRSFEGEGLQPGVVEGDWGSIRDVIYAGRGT